LSARQQRRVARAVHDAEEHTGLQLCVYAGRVGDDDPRAHAEAMLTAGGLHTQPAVLVLVEPLQRRIEVVTSPAARQRISDDAAREAVDTMTAHFREGHLAGGLIAGIESRASAAGPGHAEPGAEELPDVRE
jgi:uncharacterized membrane protein